MHLPSDHLERCDLGCSVEDSKTEKGFTDLSEVIPSQRTSGRVLELHKNREESITQPDTYTPCGLTREQKLPLGVAGGTLASPPSRVNHGCEYSQFASSFAYPFSGNACLPPSAHSLSPNTFFSNQCRYPRRTMSLSLCLHGNVADHRFPPNDDHMDGHCDDMVFWTFGEGCVQGYVPASSQCHQRGHIPFRPASERGATPLGPSDSPANFNMGLLRRDLSQAYQHEDPLLGIPTTGHGNKPSAMQDKDDSGPGNPDELPSFEVVGVSNEAPRSLKLTLEYSHQMMAKVLESTSDQLLALLQQELDKDESDIDSE